MIRDERRFACARRALRHGDFASAETALTSLLASEPLSADDCAFLLNKRGVARIALERRELARADFEAALAIVPSFAPAMANLGNLLLEAGDLDGAIAAYERAIACDADCAVAYFNLGVAYKRRGRVADGVRALREAQRLENRAIAASWRRARRR